MGNWFRFSDEQRDELRRTLKGYETGDIEHFIVEVENSCKALPYLASRQKLADHRDQLEDIEKTLKRAARDLKTMCGRGWNLIPQSQLDHATGENIVKFWKVNNECTSVAINALRSLMKVLEIIHNAKEEFVISGRGRPQADKQGLVKDIALAFQKYIASPSTYEDGDFANVVRIVLGAMNLPAKDPRRAIQKAIQQVSTD